MVNAIKKTFNMAGLAGKKLEATALHECSNRLEDCRRQWRPEGMPADLKTSLAKNQQLWKLFRTDLKRSDHPMPVDIRRNLLQLSVVVDRVTFDILENPAPEKLTMLININRNIAAGLKNS
ncbi:MAG: hypothetical protein GY868_18570 [Deltaproteobacteria bacterium]|nr:hypothetical protein [Deltaproteobacteria bacterium]